MTRAAENVLDAEDQIFTASKHSLQHLSLKGLDHFYMNQNTTHTIDAILIDDDPIVHALWKRAAQATQITLQTFFPSEDWLKTYLIHFSGFPRYIPIYIDSQLGSNLRGEELAQQLFHAGFRNLYLTTGYIGLISKQQFPWIRDILGKDPPSILGCVGNESTPV